MLTTLVTMTRGDLHPWLVPMLDSVPSGVIHQVITVPAGTPHLQWAEIRINALRHASTPFVALLDDDDVLHDGAVEWCERALRATGAGVAFTYEQRIDEFGNVVEPPETEPRMYFQARLFPRVIHHFALMRRDLIPCDAIDIERSHLFGFEWWIKARVAFAGGAVQVPRVGYSWRKRAGQYSESKHWRERYAAAQRDVGDLLQQHLPPERSLQFIPKFEP